MTGTDQRTVLDRLATDYATLRSAHEDLGLPDLARVAVRITTRAITAEDAWTESDARTGEGWVRHRSAIRLSSDPAARVDDGPPLAGEWVVDDRTSLHLAPCAEVPGRWLAWTYAERPLKDGADLEADEEAMLREVVHVLARPENDAQRQALAKPPRHGRQRVLVYHVFWGGEPDDPHAVARRFARFAGFADENLAHWKERS